jgi:hypothetical protein
VQHLAAPAHTFGGDVRRQPLALVGGAVGQQIDQVRGHADLVGRLGRAFQRVAQLAQRGRTATGQQGVGMGAHQQPVAQHLQFRAQVDGRAGALEQGPHPAAAPGDAGQHALEAVDVADRPQRVDPARAAFGPLRGHFQHAPLVVAPVDVAAGTAAGQHLVHLGQHGAQVDHRQRHAVARGGATSSSTSASCADVHRMWLRVQPSARSSARSGALPPATSARASDPRWLKSCSSAGSSPAQGRPLRASTSLSASAACAAARAAPSRRRAG